MIIILPSLFPVSDGNDENRVFLPSLFPLWDDNHEDMVKRGKDRGVDLAQYVSNHKVSFWIPCLCCRQILKHPQLIPHIFFPTPTQCNLPTYCDAHSASKALLRALLSGQKENQKCEANLEFFFSSAAALESETGSTRLFISSSPEPQLSNFGFCSSWWWWWSWRWWWWWSDGSDSFLMIGTF